MNLKSILDKISYEKAFLSIGIVFGLLVVFITPPFESPDELAHFFRAYQVSQGGFWSEHTENSSGGVIPESLPIFANAMTRGIGNQIPFHPDQKFHVSKFKEGLESSLDPKHKRFVNFPNTGSYPFLVYVPQTLGILIGRMLTHSLLIIYYLGRLGGLAFFLFAGYQLLARVANPYKEVFFVALLLPTTFYLNSMISADPVSIMVSFLACAYFLTSRHLGIPLERKNILIYLGIALVIGFIKPVYALIMLLVFCVPFSQAYSRMINIFTRIGLVGISLVGVVTTLVLGKGTSIPTRGDILTSPSIQMDYIFHNFIQFCSTAVHYLIYMIPKSVIQIIGIFGWNDTRLPWVGYVLGLIVLGLILFKKPEEVETPFKWWEIAVMGLVIAGVVSGIILFLFLTWSPAGQGSIDGFQGRYLTPIVPLVIILMRQGITKKVGIVLPKWIILVLPVILLVVSIITIGIRFY